MVYSQSETGNVPQHGYKDTDHTFHITRKPKPEARKQAHTKMLKLHLVWKKVSNITVLIILYKAVLTFAPLIVIIIPAADRKILHSSAREWVYLSTAF